MKNFTATSSVTMDKHYIRCSPRVTYEITLNNKIVYQGSDRKDVKLILDTLLMKNRGDVYVVERKSRRYMCLDDEDLEKRIVTKKED